MDLVMWLHLVAAAVWVGGLITLGALIGALRSQGVERPILQAVARRFGAVSWTAMAVAVPTGLILAWPIAWSPAMAWKFVTVGLTVVLAGWHQIFARRQSPAMRGILQGAVLLASLGIVAAAVGLGH